MSTLHSIHFKLDSIHRQLAEKAAANQLIPPEEVAIIRDAVAEALKLLALGRSELTLASASQRLCSRSVSPQPKESSEFPPNSPHATLLAKAAQQLEQRIGRPREILRRNDKPPSASYAAAASRPSQGKCVPPTIRKKEKHPIAVEQQTPSSYPRVVKYVPRVIREAIKSQEEKPSGKA